MSGAQPKRSECFGCSEYCGHGSTHVIFDPLDFIGKLAALVPKPRVNLTRFARIIHDTRPLRGPAKAVQIRSRRICHGVFASNSKYRIEIDARVDTARQQKA
jgi:hypothetical protein